jgi:hypothetical protein
MGMAQEDEVADFLAQVTPERRRTEALRLDAIFREETGFAPRLWPASILGYGRYHYRYASGREGSHLATGFSPRKAALVIYIMPGYADFGDLLARLGKHRKGKACLYVNRLEAVDEAALRALIRAGLEDLGRRWAVEAG